MYILYRKNKTTAFKPYECPPPYSAADNTDYDKIKKIQPADNPAYEGTGEKITSDSDYDKVNYEIQPISDTPTNTSLPPITTNFNIFVSDYEILKR